MARLDNQPPHRWISQRSFLHFHDLRTGKPGGLGRRGPHTKTLSIKSPLSSFLDLGRALKFRGDINCPVAWGCSINANENGNRFVLSPLHRVATVRHLSGKDESIRRFYWNFSVSRGRFFSCLVWFDFICTLLYICIFVDDMICYFVQRQIRVFW